MQVTAKVQKQLEKQNSVLEAPAQTVVTLD